MRVYLNRVNFYFLLLITPMVSAQAEELIIKDNRIVMFREDKASKDYFFNLDKIIYIEKDLKSIENKYKIGLIGGKTINLYDIDNYRKLMTAFMKSKNPNSKNNSKKIKYYKSSSDNIKKVPNMKIENYNSNDEKIVNTHKEEEIIKDMKIEGLGKIIALDPNDIEDINKK